ncbi:MAG: sugar phosphorylase [Anaerolineae bacterium]|nr:sugar phosphorylase [Anaerolineae bacterium]
MTDIIRHLLREIYGPEQIESIYPDLIQRIEQVRPTAQPQPKSFSEKDVVLITYGDSLNQNGEHPLRTLHQFARTHVAGAISTIHILPFFPYSSDDGFSVKDFYAVNPALGTWADVEQLGRDFDLMFDAVFNHMSAQSAWFKAFLADDPTYVGLFRSEDPNLDFSEVTRPRTSPLLTPFAKDNGETIYVWTTFSADQVDFDVCHPNTLLRLLDILLFYVRKGARVIRLDAIAYLWKEVGTACIHLPETHAVIQLMRAVLDEVAPDVLIITETNVPHAENVSYFGDGDDEAQLVYNFVLPPLLFHTLLSGSARKLREWVNTLHTPSAQTTFFNFTASHDGIGVRPVEDLLEPDELAALIHHTEKSGGRVSYRRNPNGSQSPYELNITYVDAVTDADQPVAIRARRFLLSQAIMLSLAGMPAIYIHSLLGSHNNIEGMRQTGQNRTINRAKLKVDDVRVELEDPATFRAQVFAGYLHLIRTRIAHPAFHPNGTQQALNLGSDSILALLRTAPDQSEHMLAVYNVTDQIQPVDLNKVTDSPVMDLLSQKFVPARVSLEPYQTLWLRLP